MELGNAGGVAYPEGKRRVLLGELYLRFLNVWMERSAESGEVGAGDGAVGVTSVRPTCVGLLITGSPTKLSLLTGAGPAEPGDRVS